MEAEGNAAFCPGADGRFVFVPGRQVLAAGGGCVRMGCGSRTRRAGGAFGLRVAGGCASGRAGGDDGHDVARGEMVEVGGLSKRPDQLSTELKHTIRIMGDGLVLRGGLAIELAPRGLPFGIRGAGAGCVSGVGRGNQDQVGFERKEDAEPFEVRDADGGFGGGEQHGNAHARRVVSLGVGPPGQAFKNAGENAEFLAQPFGFSGIEVREAQIGDGLGDRCGPEAGEAVAAEAVGLAARVGQKRRGQPECECHLRCASAGGVRPGFAPSGGCPGQSECGSGRVHGRGSEDCCAASW